MQPFAFVSIDDLIRSKDRIHVPLSSLAPLRLQFSRLDCYQGLMVDYFCVRGLSRSLYLQSSVSPGVSSMQASQDLYLLVGVKLKRRTFRVMS